MTVVKQCLKISLILTGGEVITEELGLDLKSATIESIRYALVKVVVTKENTTSLKVLATQHEIEARVNQIRVQLEETTSEFDKEKLQERLAKLLAA